MSTLDDIAQERQRLSDRLARLDSDRMKLTEQLAELDAAERVLARFSQPGGRRRGRRAAQAVPAGETKTPRRDQRTARTTAAGEAAAPKRGRQRRTGRAARQSASTPVLGDATLRAVEALGAGTSAEDIRNYLAQEFGMQVRPNHLGMALQRHRRAGRLEQNDSRWSMVPAGV
jgi:hypothetical protein